MSLRWSEVGRICFYALGGATICGAMGLGLIVTEKKIGRQLLIPTETLHSYETLRCWLTELETLILPECQVLYLKLVGDLDRMTTARKHLSTRPKELDGLFSAHIVNTYITMANETCSRIVFQFEKKNKENFPLRCRDVRSLLTNIKKTMFDLVTAALLMAKRYPQAEFTLPVPIDKRNI